MALHLVLFMFSYVSFDLLHRIACVDCFNAIRFIPVVSRRSGFKFAEAIILALVKLLMCLLSGHTQTERHICMLIFLINQPRFYVQQPLTPSRNILRYRARENSRVFGTK